MPLPKVGSEWIKKEAVNGSRIIFKIVKAGFWDCVVTYRWADMPGFESKPEVKSRQSLMAFYRKLK